MPQVTDAHVATEPDDRPAPTGDHRAPRLVDPFVAMVTRRFGGWGGHHERPETGSTTTVVWAIITATVTWAILGLRQLPCRETLTDAPNTFYRLCYSDIPVLYQTRKIQEGANPYGLEYPVLINSMVELARKLTQLAGGVVGPTTWPNALHSLNLFTFFTAAMLYVCFVVLVWSHVAMNHQRRWDAMMLAAAPVVAATGLVNWDLQCVALTSLALLAWAKRRPGVAGALIGLGVAAKLYPVLLLVPLVALCLRTRRIQEAIRTVLAAVLAWLVPNLIIFTLYPQQWTYFWTFNQDRGPDLGSLWYVFKLMGFDVPDKISTYVTVLDVVGAVAVAGLCLWAPRRPRVGQVAFLMVAWFLIVNKVYSPQYVLWLLPLVVLARPRWRDYLIWTVAELGYFCAIWGHLAGTLYAAGSQQDKLYWFATFVRVGAELWLCAMVVLDIFNPADDPIRQAGLDDPIGGVLLDGPVLGTHDGETYERADVVDPEPDDEAEEDPGDGFRNYPGEPDASTRSASSLDDRDASADAAPETFATYPRNRRPVPGTSLSGTPDDDPTTVDE